MHDFVMKYSGIGLVLLVLLPNAFFFRFPPNNVPERHSQTTAWKLLETLENLSRIAVFIIPLFCRIETPTGTTAILGACIMLGVLFYYFLYVNYFAHNREYSLLFAPFSFIPVPMAVLPVACFVLYAILARSAAFAISTCIFGITHIVISYREYERTKRSPSGGNT